MTRLEAQYDRSAFAALVERETDHLELKTGASAATLQEAIVAFSNTEGGIILIGVRDDRTVVGRRLDQGTDDKIHEAALAAHHPGRYTVREIAVGDTPVVAVEVKRREEGFAQTSDGRLLVRRGGRNIALIGDDAFQFMTERVLRRFESSVTDLPISDADSRAITALREAYGWPENVDLSARLEERGLASGGFLTVSGSLVLTDPVESLDLVKAVIEVRRYPDDGTGTDYDRREVFGGPLPDQIQNATEFVFGELGSDLVVAGVHRYDIPKLPKVVIRETIANAVAHRSYEINRTVVLVELRNDRVVVTSPGRLPEPVTVDTIREAQAARNPNVIAILRRFRLAEDAGRGVDIIEDEMEMALLDPPVFAEIGNVVRVTLPLIGPITPRERAWLRELTAKGAIDSRDQLLLVEAARGRELTNGHARNVLKTEDSGLARRALHRLRDAGLLRQHGKRGGAVYALGAHIAPPAAYRMSTWQLTELVLTAASTDDLTNERVRELTGLDRQQVRQLLRSLVVEGRLEQSGQRRGTRYSLPNSQHHEDSP